MIYADIKGEVKQGCPCPVSIYNTGCCFRAIVSHNDNMEKEYCKSIKIYQGL